MNIEQLDSFPPKSNPFNYDAYHMGTQIGNNCVIMMENFDHKECKYFIVVNTLTGERIKITF